MKDLDELKELITSRLDLDNDMSDEELQKVISRTVKQEILNGEISLRDYLQATKDIYNSFRNLDILQELLDDSNITEIMINGTDNIFIEKNGRLVKTGYRFSSREKLINIIQQIVGTNNKIVNESIPITDTRLKDGSRVNIIMPPISNKDPVVTIRKFPKSRITEKELIAYGTVDKKTIEFLKTLVKAKYNIFISGGTSSGKTTLLNVLSDFVPKDERVIVIEDNIELQITNIPNIVRLEARNANSEGVGEISIRNLIRASLRMRPDRIVVGEVRGKETLDMLTAMNTGHDGCLSTGHANSTKDMLLRLETMVLMGCDLPVNAIRRQIASGIDIITHLSRLRDRTRKIVEISEVIGYEDGEILLNTIYKFNEIASGDRDSVKGELVNVSKLKNCEKLQRSGISIIY